jgi:chaperonin GroEL
MSAKEVRFFSLTSTSVAPPTRLQKASSPAAASRSSAAKAIDGLNAANDDQKIGIAIVRKAANAPARQIAENAGPDGAVGVGTLIEKGDASWGYDAQREYKDMVKAGIIDPTKVVRTAPQDAASVAGLLVTTEAMVGSKPEKPMPALPSDGGMDF